MKTEQLISQLARDIHPVPPGALIRRLLLAASVGSMVTLACVALLYGFRPDLPTAVLGMAFWIKAGFTLAVASIGFVLVERVGRPAAELNARLLLIAVPFGLIIAIGCIELAHTPPSERVSTWLGQTWRSCPFSIAFLALPPLALLLLALRRLAPTRLTIAGFAAGILSGGLAATAYGLHCPERTASFVATWYTAGILLCGVIGAIAGRRLLRW
jgi:hypothetical protein